MVQLLMIEEAYISISAQGDPAPTYDHHKLVCTKIGHMTEHKTHLHTHARTHARRVRVLLKMMAGFPVESAHLSDPDPGSVCWERFREALQLGLGAAHLA